MVSAAREDLKTRNRDAILEAARSVFTTLGYDTATVRDIIRHTDLSVGAFYNHFPSKAAVRQALADVGLARFHALLAANTGDGRGRGLIDRLRSIVCALYSLLLELAPDAPGPSGSVLEAPEMTAVLGAVREALDRDLQCGARAGVDEGWLAGSCLAVMREIGGRLAERGPDQLPAAVDFTVTMLMHGGAGVGEAAKRRR